MTLITVEAFYFIAGAVLATVAVRIAGDPLHPRRWGAAAFWALLAAVFIFGQVFPPMVVGYVVLAMVVLAAAGQVTPTRVAAASQTERAAEAERLGNRLFWPALIVPVVALVGSLVLGRIHVGGFWFVDPRQVALISLGIGALIAIDAARRVTGARTMAPAQEGGRLLQSIGWALILPQLLAALGGIFHRAGVGVVVADLVGRILPTQIPFVAVAAYCLGMMLFTICLGNAFAAFAVITGGIGLPLIVQQHHGNPAIMAAIGMLSGYCGTLLTPMAANFNLVPALLLELKDPHGVIKAQAPMALVIFVANVALMYFCVYRF